VDTVYITNLERRSERHFLPNKIKIYTAAEAVLASALEAHMKIQEMRSGLDHLRNKSTAEAQEVQDPFASEEGSQTLIGDCELDQPKWAVISSLKIEAACVTYEEAQQLLVDLASKGVLGLSLVSNEAAFRLHP